MQSGIDDDEATTRLFVILVHSPFTPILIRFVVEGYWNIKNFSKKMTMSSGKWIEVKNRVMTNLKNERVYLLIV